jgi:small subunit ribosomal protein S18
MERDNDFNDNDLNLDVSIDQEIEKMPRRISGVTAKDQRRIAKAIKRARTMALLPFVAD